MFGKLFQTSQNGNGLAEYEADPDINGNGNNDRGKRRLAAVPAPRPATTAALGQFDSFGEIYETASTAAPESNYSILKVAEMLKSPHLAGMAMESKRAALMMALEAAGVAVKDMLQDAMVRQRALNDYEEGQQRLLREFEAAKAEENRQIQAELDRVTTQYMSRIQANVDAVAQQQDVFRNWQRTKQQEAAVITEATAYCNVPESAIDSLAVVLERSGTRR